MAHFLLNHNQGPLATLHSFLIVCLAATLAHCCCQGRVTVLVAGAWLLSIYFPQAVARQCFLLSASKIFSLPQRKTTNKTRKEKNWAAGRKKLLIENRSVRPGVLQLSQGHPSTSACCVLSARELHLFSSPYCICI